MPEEDAPVATTAENAYHNGRPRRVSQYTWVAKSRTRKGAGSLGKARGLEPPDLRICVTSRPEIDIQIVLEPLTSHDISLHDERGQKKDILDYIRHVQVVMTDRKMRRWRPEDK